MHLTFICSFILQLSIEYLLCARYFSRHWHYNREQKGQRPSSQGGNFLVGKKQ